MSAAMLILHWLAAFVVMAEALNKLERTAPFAPGLTPHKRLVDGLKALAWLLLAMGAGGGLIGPFLQPLGLQETPSRWWSHAQPSLAETAVLLGFAVLIVRTRVKEG